MNPSLADRLARLVVTIAAAVALASLRAFAQGSGPLAQGPVLLPPSQIVEKVGVDQKLNAQVPLDLVFRDEAGKEVKLGDYFGRRPVVLALVYYECPMLCTMTLNGLVKSFKPLGFEIGKEFEVVTVSFDPRETPELAAKKKATYIQSFGKPQAAAGWHFLTGQEPSIRALTDAVGFRYIYDERSQQYAHASAIMVITPSGKVSRYFYGLEYSTRDLKLGLMEASDERIGTLADAIQLLCFHYDPTTAKYGWAVMGILRAAAVLTMAALGTFMFVSIRREKRAAAMRQATATEAHHGT
jgi:protein SCO1/2